MNEDKITRKEAVKKMGKYAALTALGTFTILTPKAAQASSPCNQPPCGNGWGNGGPNGNGPGGNNGGGNGNGNGNNWGGSDYDLDW